MTGQPSELADWTATELTAGYRAGSVSPVEATRAALDRIERYDTTYNAYCLVDPDRALAQARESEARWSAGEPIGPLDGVPTSIKDLLLTQGWPTLRGSLNISPDQEWSVDAPATARLRESGAVLLGKTTTPELGWKGVTDNPLTGVTRNPWDPSRTPGGSSGGAATAVALGMGALAIGTDGGGSVRIPAGFSGVVGMKMTYGRVPHYPASPFGTLAHVGPMSWSVDDAALMLDVITGFDPRDWSALEPPSASYVSSLRAGVAGLRVAYSADLGYVDVDPEIADLVSSAVDVLASLGAEVEAADPGFTDPVEAYHALWFSGVAKVTEHLTPDQRARMDPALREVCEMGAGLSALDYLGATAERMVLGRLMGEFHERFDLLVTPTLPLAAFEAGLEAPSGWGSPRWTSWTPFSYPFNMTQQPAVSVPCGFTSAGLPAGLQIVGPRHADGRVLAAAKAYQDAASWLGKRSSP
ncbi:MAG: amidase [Propionibacteriales bacterium]|nr:amidase [Propionibacteriales bacterium]